MTTDGTLIYYRVALRTNPVRMSTKRLDILHQPRRRNCACQHFPGALLAVLLFELQLEEQLPGLTLPLDQNVN
jgi:hypothetical protein